MGTRHTTAVKQNGEYKVAQYGQWDGYPEGAGVSILSFLKKCIKKGKMDTFRKHISECTEASLESIREKWVEVGADPESDFVSDQEFGKGMFVTFKVNELVPSDGGVYNNFDTDVTWKEGVEI